MNSTRLMLAAMAVLLAVDVHAQAIFGSVRTVAGVPVEGVQVRATQRFERITTTTDSGGGYVLGSGLSGTYQVEAIEAGYVFTPASTNVTISGSSIRVDFTTPATAPTTGTLPATNVLATSATLNSSVRPNGADTFVWYEYGPTASYGTISPPLALGSGTAFVTKTRTVGDLLNNKTYHFRSVASNSLGVRFGNDLTFTTLSGIPTVTTLDPTDGGATSMRLNGSAIPNGANATAWFEVGTTTNYGNLSAGQNVGDGTAPIHFNQMLVGLVAGTTYHYRAVAVTSLDTNYGVDALFTPGFGDIIVGLPGVANRSSAAWGDYNNDGRLDFLLTGITGTALISQLWRNTGSGFVNMNAGLPGIYLGSVAWGDYDNDGRLDILLAGSSSAGRIAQVWHNTTGGFVNINAGLPGVQESSVAWGDYDNDGRLDNLITGTTNDSGSGAISQVWRNTGSGFMNINVGLPGVYRSSVAWGDYDNDGRLDILLTGSTGGGQIAQVWHNTGNGFVNINAGLPGVSFGSAAWGDYDNDGRLDILLTGSTGAGQVAQVWRNTSGGFVNINAGLPEIYLSSAAWGDYDNDGRLDILLAGSTGSDKISKVWRNTGSGFTDIGAGLPGVNGGTVAWGNYDNDGRLDISLTGLGRQFNPVTQQLDPIAQVWRNHLPATNTAPTAPSGLNVSVSNAIATLTWNPPTDNETPAAGLTYNLRIGTTPGGSDVLSPMSEAGGFRLLPQLGNAQAGLNAAFRFDLGTTYYWSVQAVDNAFAGSPFAPEQSFKFLPVSVPPASTTIVPGDLNGDGVVDQSELGAVLANYWPNSPWLEMTDPMKLPDGFFQFALTNASAWIFSVEVTTNLMDWEFLGPAYPVYQFLDPLGTNAPQRHYRLRWP